MQTSAIELLEVEILHLKDQLLMQMKQYLLQLMQQDGDKTLTLPNETGTILSTASSITNSNLANSAVTIGGTSVSLGATASTIAGLTSLASTTLISGAADGANSITLASGNITFEGSTADAQ